MTMLPLETETYTPTLTIFEGSSLLSYDITQPWLYTRVGDIVTVSGLVAVTTTGPGAVGTEISLPIPSAAGNGSGTFTPTSAAAATLGPASIIAMFTLDSGDVAVVNQEILGAVPGAQVQIAFQYLVG